MESMKGLYCVSPEVDIRATFTPVSTKGLQFIKKRIVMVLRLSKFGIIIVLHTVC
jgi:hypothetical protein